jgi:DNA mismatch endonuclease (patch repair protein)
MKMIQKYGVDVALKSWSGTEHTDQDFSCDDTWYEIKSTVSGSASVKISSVEQLDTNQTGHLVIVTLDKTSEADASRLTLNSMYEMVLSSIPKGKDTKPEIIVRKYLFSQGFRYRKNVASMPGKPDIVLPKYRTCIFVNGCFWHLHEGCKYFVWPKSNSDFWEHKLRTNRDRDLKAYQSKQEEGWHVIVVWECELKKEKQKHTLDTIVDKIHSK